jgi:mono/diheme cytochrome c family protein
MRGKKRRWLVLVLAGLASTGVARTTSVHDLRSQYQFSCSRCHGLDGTAKGPGGIRLPGRVLADRKWLAQQKDEALLKSILEGKGAMPGFKYKLSLEEAKRMLSEIIRPMARRAR